MAVLKDLTVLGSSRFTADMFGTNITANKLITSGGTSSHFVKGDGTLDSSTYVTTTALAAWTGSANITTLGTITTGTWSGTAIANNKLANSSVTINSKSVSLGSSLTLTLDDMTDGSTRKLGNYVLKTGDTMSGSLTFDASTTMKSIYHKSASLNLNAINFAPNGNITIGYSTFRTNNLTIETIASKLQMSFGTNVGVLMSGTSIEPNATNTVSLGSSSKYFSENFSVYQNAYASLTASGMKVILAPFRTAITNAKKARTFAIKVPFTGQAVQYKISIYSGYGLLPVSTILCGNGGYNRTAAAYCALYPSYAVLGSYPGVVRFARNADTNDASVFILLGKYDDGHEYQAGSITIDYMAHNHINADALAMRNFTYELLDLDSETMFTKITEAANADEHFASVTAPKGYFESALVIPAVAPTSPDASKYYLYVNPSGSYAI